MSKYCKNIKYFSAVHSLDLSIQAQFLGLMILQSHQCVEEATIEDGDILQNDEDGQGVDGQEEDNMEEPGIVMIILYPQSLLTRGCLVIIMLFLLSPFSP